MIFTSFFMTKSLSFNVNFRLCMILVLTVHSGTARLLCYRPLILVPPMYSGTDHLNMYQLYNKFDTGILEAPIQQRQG